SSAGGAARILGELPLRRFSARPTVHFWDKGRGFLPTRCASTAAPATSQPSFDCDGSPGTRAPCPHGQRRTDNRNSLRGTLDGSDSRCAARTVPGHRPAVLRL